ncbi:MAG: aminotransferase class I/II-fold pyridoxal phosphate-dependent enzyme [Gemmatimonadaceae bacterium]|nr:aminotransferase class I/II-fold pyridoxal phosphate-dependent enzyme [Gemmatimonadaceae bacterium]
MQENHNSAHPETLAVHGGRDDFRALGVHAPPIDLSSTYPVNDLAADMASLDAMVAGGEPTGSAVYSRLYNPTVSRAEQAIAALEGAQGTVAFSSGMAAYTAALLVARQRGGHVVAVRPLYGSADHLLASGMLGVDVTFATADEVQAAIRPETALVAIETPANPTLDLVDIGDVVRQAGSVPVMVDATFATPVLLRPLDFGATLVLHSATKALAGHGDVLAGVISTNDVSWLGALRQIRLLTGSVLHPMAAFLLHRGLQTLPLRVRAAQANAQRIAELLQSHPAVAWVHYPGLPGGDPHGLLGRELVGPGSTMAFDLRSDDPDAPARLLAALTLITPAVSLGSTDTLIQHPASLTHRVVDTAVREHHGISSQLMRLSVGLEHVDDIWADLSQALSSTWPGVGNAP